MLSGVKPDRPDRQGGKVFGGEWEFILSWLVSVFILTWSNCSSMQLFLDYFRLFYFFILYVGVQGIDSMKM